MQLLLILAVLAALLVSECGPSGPVSGAVGRLMIAGGGIALPVLFAVAVSGLIARGLRADFSRHGLLLRRFRQLRRLHAGLWLVSAGGITCGLGWAQLVRFNWHLDHTLLVDELLILAPVLLPLVLSWAAFYEADRAVQVGLSGISEGGSPIFAARKSGQSPGCSALRAGLPTRWEYVALHFRHYVGVLLVPLFGFLAVQDALELIAPDAAEEGYRAPVLLVSLAVLFLLFPVLLRYVWQTRPLPPGPLRTRLEDAAGRVGFRARDILVWQTGGMVVGAAVAGLVRRLRYVFLSDALLSRLPDEEIEAVFGHEVGHVRHHHLLLRVLAMVAPLSLWVLLGQAFPEGVAGLLNLPDTDSLALGGVGAKMPAGTAMLGAMAVYVLVVFGYYSRQLEHQADLFGCRWATPEAQRPAVETFTSALERLAASSGTGREARSWQHASIARRIDFLNQLGRDPKRELRFQRRVRILGSLVICTVLSPVAYQLLLG
jgi:STE24 endopeptidase